MDCTDSQVNPLLLSKVAPQMVQKLFPERMFHNSHLNCLDLQVDPQRCQFFCSPIGTNSNKSFHLLLYAYTIISKTEHSAQTTNVSSLYIFLRLYSVIFSPLALYTSFTTHDFEAQFCIPDEAGSLHFHFSRKLHFLESDTQSTCHT